MSLHLKISAFLVVVLLAGLSLPEPSAKAQDRFSPNYDEARIPEYQLPPIIDAKTAEASNFSQAWGERRAELLEEFAEQMYGHQPSGEVKMTCEQFETGESVGGQGVRQQWRVTLSTDHGSQEIDLLVYTPKEAERPVPCFLGLNFYGNHTVAADPEIRVTSSWSRNNEQLGVSNNRASEASRGRSSDSWPIEQILSAGFGVATAYCGDVDPDMHDEFANGVHALFPEHRPSAEHPDRWGTISAWAWGLSRMLDCLEKSVAEVDASRVAVIGHSRLGKTALWAGATDERFAAVISNNSGCGGAALSRRAYGETVGRINDSFPHWFCPNFKQYNENESALPIDQHQLIALIAPRLVYVASATEDQWADPHGEFLAVHHAAELFQKLATTSGSAHDQSGDPVKHVGYHLRAGRHAISAWDWAHYLRFAEQM